MPHAAAGEGKKAPSFQHGPNGTLLAWSSSQPLLSAHEETWLRKRDRVFSFLGSVMGVLAWLYALTFTPEEAHTSCIAVPLGDAMEFAGDGGS